VAKAVAAAKLETVKTQTIKPLVRLGTITSSIDNITAKRCDQQRTWMNRVIGSWYGRNHKHEAALWPVTRDSPRDSHRCVAPISTLFAPAGVKCSHKCPRGGAEKNFGAVSAAIESVAIGQKKDEEKPG